MWRYFRIGYGKRWKYPDVIFHPSVEIVKPYHFTSKIDTASSLSLSKKPRVDRKVNSLKFCSQVGCIESFLDKDTLAEHELLGNLTIQSVSRLLMDRARSSYVDK